MVHGGRREVANVELLLLLVRHLFLVAWHLLLVDSYVNDSCKISLVKPIA